MRFFRRCTRSPGGSRSGDTFHADLIATRHAQQISEAKASRRSSLSFTVDRPRTEGVAERFVKSARRIDSNACSWSRSDIFDARLPNSSPHYRAERNHEGTRNELIQSHERADGQTSVRRHDGLSPAELLLSWCVGLSPTPPRFVGHARGSPLVYIDRLIRCKGMGPPGHQVMVRVLIISGIRLYREGLAQALMRVDTVNVVGQVSDREPALDQLRSASLDAVLIDAFIAEGPTVVRDIRAVAPAVPIVALGVGESEADILSWIEAGIAAFVTHEESLTDLVTAVHRAVRGEFVCSPQMAGSLVRKVAALAANRHRPVIDTPLTRREWEIGSLLEQHLSNKEIAVRLGVELATVKNHVHNLLEKLGVHRRTDAVRMLHRVLR
jgi:two-component system, NarL family, nitrate/nitrite response regulator NarL